MLSMIVFNKNPIHYEQTLLVFYSTILVVFVFQLDIIKTILLWHSTNCMLLLVFSSPLSHCQGSQDIITKHPTSLHLFMILNDENYPLNQRIHATKIYSLPIENRLRWACSSREHTVTVFQEKTKTDWTWVWYLNL